MLAPIILFVYNRPWHTQQTLEALSANHLAKESTLIVFSDGPKPGSSDEEISKIVEVQNVIKSKQWCGNVELITSTENKGLAKSIIQGVTEVINKYGRVIVLEDDLITSPWFLTFMNEGLELYNDVSNVYSVNGYMFPITTNKTNVVLLPFTSTWGWSTWKEKWQAFHIEPSQYKIINDNEFLKQQFNLADYDYTSMLLNANHSWGIHWYYSVFVRHGLGLFPTKSLVENIGFDGSGINCGSQYLAQNIYPSRIIMSKISYIELSFYAKYLSNFKEIKIEKLSILKKVFKKFLR